MSTEFLILFYQPHRSTGKRPDLLFSAEESFQLGDIRVKAPFAFDPGVHLRVVKADAGEKLLREAVGVAEEIDAVLHRIGHFLFVFLEVLEYFVGVLRVNDRAVWPHIVEVNRSEGLPILVIDPNLVRALPRAQAPAEIGGHFREIVFAEIPVYDELGVFHCFFLPPQRQRLLGLLHALFQQ